MSQQVQELIDKIKSEGIQEAEKKAQDIISSAEREAQEMLEEVQKEAEHIKAGAQQAAQGFQEAAERKLQQSARDILLDVRQKIDALLKGIVQQELKTGLTPAQLSQMIIDLAKAQGNSDAQVIVSLSANDEQELKKGFMGKLQKELKAGITLRAVDDIAGGFTISFDNGKSCFDFTETSLVEYLSRYLNDEVTQILKKASERTA